MVQLGARRRYAVPRLLERAGMLEMLYTDSSAYSLLGRCARMMGPFANKSIQRLARRTIDGVPRKKIYSTDVVARLGKNGTADFRHRHQLFAEKMIRRGVQRADIVYSMYHEALDFMQYAKQAGLRNIVDVYINPVTASLMNHESESFPDWGQYKSDEDLELGRRLWAETAALADVLLCPSEWVAEGVREITPEAAHKIRIVPNGCSIQYSGQVNAPVKGRVLFAGGNALRKGLHYLGRAATLLKESMPHIEIRVAGKLPEKVVNHPVCKDIVFLGKLDADGMKAEYLSGDVFVLPSLSEGFAGVVAEALGAGCPVVVTREAGCPVVHEREGLVVPSRDAKALADAIARVVNDRELRERLASESRKQFSFYSEEEWQKRLVDCIEEVAASGDPKV
jgi:glycosyltransferase involved in cell wall biosynthesis